MISSIVGFTRGKSISAVFWRTGGGVGCKAKVGVLGDDLGRWGFRVSLLGRDLLPLEPYVSSTSSSVELSLWPRGRAPPSLIPGGGDGSGGWYNGCAPARSVLEGLADQECLLRYRSSTPNPFMPSTRASMASTPETGATTEILSIEPLIISSIGVCGGVSNWLREDETESRKEYVVGSDQSCEETEGPVEERSCRKGVGVISPLPNGTELVLKALSSV